jgi:hypothetical protein
MQPKLFVALQLEVAHHFSERCAADRTRRLELPLAFGTTKTPKMLALNPYQLSAHGGRILQTAIWTVCRVPYIVKDSLPCGTLYNFSSF